MSGQTPSYGQIDSTYGLRLATIDLSQDGPIWMVNLMKYKKVAAYVDGTAGLSGQEADDRYAPLDVLAAIGAEVVLFGDVDTQLFGDTTTWDRVGVVKYPSRRSFIEMQSRPDFIERHVHKEAGMEFTIVMGCVPRETPRRPVSEIEDGPEAEDSVIVMHVISYHDPVRGPETMRSDQNASAAGWFDVEGTIIGDGRAWHEVRFNQFPSRKAFFEVVADPKRQAAQPEYREPEIADTYAVILRPSINRISASLRN